MSCMCSMFPGPPERFVFCSSFYRINVYWNFVFRRKINTNVLPWSNAAHWLMKQQEFYVCKVFLWILNRGDVLKMQELILSNRTQLTVLECYAMINWNVYMRTDICCHWTECVNDHFNYWMSEMPFRLHVICAHTPAQSAFVKLEILRICEVTDRG